MWGCKLPSSSESKGIYCEWMHQVEGIEGVKDMVKHLYLPGLWKKKNEPVYRYWRYVMFYLFLLNNDWLPFHCDLILAFLLFFGWSKNSKLQRKGAFYFCFFPWKFQHIEAAAAETYSFKNAWILVLPLSSCKIEQVP